MPALILTARSDLESKVENFQAGADDYVVKPVAMAELAIRVQALLRRGPVLQENVLRAADLELNRLTRQVKRAGKRIELSPKEYASLDQPAGNVLPAIVLETPDRENQEGRTEDGQKEAIIKYQARCGRPYHHGSGSGSRT